VLSSNLNASMAAQVEIKLSWVSDADINSRSCRYVTTLALLKPHIAQCFTPRPAEYY